MKFKIEAPITLARFWELRTEMSDTFRSKLAQLELDQVAAIREAVEQGVAIYFKDDAMSFPAQALIVSGLKQ